jgi:broad-specificity NMP kinase
VTGPPGVGKTTVSSNLAVGFDLDRWVVHRIGNVQLALWAISSSMVRL